MSHNQPSWVAEEPSKTGQSAVQGFGATRQNEAFCLYKSEDTIIHPLKIFKKVVERNPLERLATPEEIARVVAFVSNPMASFVAGANWYVDGGSTNHVQF